MFPMSIMKLLQQAQGGTGLSQLAQQFGLDDGKAQDLAQMLAPAIGQAAKKRAEGGQADTVLAFMRGEDKASFFDDPAAAATPEGMAQGRSFLDGLMGDAGATDGLASAAAERAGVDPGTVAQFLPALAAMAQGGLQKQMPDATIDAMSSGGGLMGMVSGFLGGGASGQSSGLGMLNDLLDADGDGSAVDDILGRFMK
jgi:hypothetical protein